MNLQKRTEGLLKAEPQKRIDFTINRFCDSGEIWALQSNKDGKFVQYIDKDGRILFPLFPEIEFAQLYQTNEWSDTTPVTFEIGEFFYELVPFLNEHKAHFSIFPSLDLDELNILTPNSFALKLQEVLDESYGEYYELDYV
ncbi:hypothetical protein A4G20_07505 [Pasteurellaceae bacterium RH1A]|nr:hypothetical protein A4G20_07505 [Pasteurellaceae bacterium RH1A]